MGSSWLASGDVAGCGELGAGGGGSQRDGLGGAVAGGDQLGDGGDPARAAAGGSALQVDDRVEAARDQAADHVEPGAWRGQGHGLEAGRDLLGGLPAWRVVRRPRWPVLAAWSMSSTSRPRTSPTMMRSGRMRRALRTRLPKQDLASALHVGWACLEPDDLRARDGQLGNVLNGHDSLRRRDGGGEH